MKRENLIILLNQQKDKLQDLKLDEIHWIDETSNIVSNIFGKESEQVKQVKDINIRIGNNQIYFGDYDDPMKNRIRAEKYMTSFITQVENTTYEKVNTYNSEKEYKLSKTLTITFLSIIISGVFGLGFYFGNNKFDKEKIELNDRVNILNSEKAKLLLKIKEQETLLKNKDNVIK